MRIVIIGAGVAGLSSYLFLNKYLLRDAPNEHSVQIYEAYDVHRMKYNAPGAEAVKDNSTDEPLFSSKLIGNAIGIGKNGLSVLGRIDDDGETLSNFERSGCKVSKWRIGTARGWRIADASVQSSTNKNDGGKGQATDTIMIARQVAWEILRNLVLSIDSEAIAQKRVLKVETLSDGKVSVQFADGSLDIADLLIGADGLRSVVRRTIFENHNDFVPLSWIGWLSRRTPTKKDYILPHYEGLTGHGGFVPNQVLKNTGYEEGTMSITFGPNGFFGYGYVGPINQLGGHQDTNNTEKLAAWWSTFSSDVPRPYQKENGSRKEFGPDLKTTFDRQSALQDLLKRHKTWSVPEIHAILDYVKENVGADYIYPTYTTPELPSWQKHSMVLVGDAAHALQPSSGQGASQALEDAEALALLLKSSLDSVSSKSERINQIRKALTTYERLRKPRLHKIYVESQKMSQSKLDMNIVKEHIMYFAIWVVNKLGVQKALNDELFEYDLPFEVKKLTESFQAV